MKVLIDIPKESYDFAKECKSKGSSKYDWGLTYNNTVFMIANGTPISDNVTNGDIIKAIFPNVEIVRQEISSTSNNIVVRDNSFLGAINRFHADWWDAPYKRGNEDGSN